MYSTGAFVLLRAILCPEICHMTPVDQLREYIHAEAQAWVADWVARRRAVLAKRGINASGELIRSMEYAAVQVFNQAITNTIEIAFDEHGRYVDMRRLNVPEGGVDYIQNLAAWIVKKGLYDRFVQGYIQRRKLKKAPPSVLNNMAWAIAIKRRKTRRPRAWYNKSKSAAITDLFNQVAAGMPQLVSDEIKKGFTQ